ncbi:MAG: branched-chain amino acid ABC transporter permease [Thermotoga sp.]|nr:MAG: branched-chain amino acid ABC transporter permease [Thermotoga sp.]
MKGRKWIYILIALMAGFLLPFYVGPYPLGIMTNVFTYMALGLSWDMMLRAGQLSFGTSGFFGLGGYTALLTTLYLGLDPLLSIFVGGIFSALVAFVLGYIILRLRGIYFAITTLALAGVFTVIARNLHDFTGGPEGKILPTTIFDGNPTYIYWLTFSIALGTILVSELFQRTKIRFAITAMRNDEITAQSSGIDIFKYLLFVFVITSAIQGIVGGAYAQQYGFVSPESTFSSNFLLLPIAMCLTGGIYSTLGPIIGSIILGILSEYLKLRFPYGHLLIYGIIIVVIVLLMPRGILGFLKSFRYRFSKGGETG